MNTLKIKLYQSFANYRPHYSMQVRHSYPLPPPSAVLGLVHMVLGMKPGETYKDEGETIKGMDVAILGRYGGIGWDYQWLLSPQIKGDRNILFTSSVSPLKGIKFKQIPGRIQLLIDIDLLLYLRIDFNKYLNETKSELKEKLNWKSEDEVLEGIKRAFEKPAETPYLGRAEDLIVIEEVNVVEVNEQEVYELKNYSAWVPISIAEHFDIYGPIYNLPGYYEKKEIKVKVEKKDKKWWIRDFNFHSCVYAEPQEIGINKELSPLETFYDQDKKVPLFFILKEQEDGNMGKK
ncbi:MAG: CRISPR-associated protein Cas5 [Candidatus Omnitrophica bacterium]|nr:CRISPR-associated protein Cas5 [Candidatus Omnitrophota bacterium]